MVVLCARSRESEGLTSQVLSSIGKLAAVADIKSRGDSSERKRLLIGVFLSLYTDTAKHYSLKLPDLDEELDTINVQNTLRDQLVAAIPARRNALPSMEAYATQHAQNLADRPTFRKLFIEVTQQLVNGTALGIEDLVDALTLKHNSGESSGDPVIALERLLRDEVS